MASNNNSTGYGPRGRLYYSGNSTDYPIWETRFLSYLYTQNQDVYTAILPKGVADDHKDFVQHNHSAYAELAQVLDERSLQLIMTDVPQDGRGALALLRKHYQSTEKPRVLSLYEELTTLRMRDTEDVTDYLIRAETAVTGLRSAKETITDNLIIAMILKGLPESYKSFIVVHTQMDKVKTLTEFKAALNTYANTESLRDLEQATTALRVSQPKYATPYMSKKSVQCFACGKFNHKATDCPHDRASMYCEYCQALGHIVTVYQREKREMTTASTATSQYAESDRKVFQF